MPNAHIYKPIDVLPANALPVATFAKVAGFNTTNYVYIKYNRYYFGMPNRKGKNTKMPYPGYDIVVFKGTNYVINYE